MDTVSTKRGRAERHQYCLDKDVPGRQQESFQKVPNAQFQPFGFPFQAGLNFPTVTLSNTNVKGFNLKVITLRFCLSRISLGRANLLFAFDPFQSRKKTLKLRIPCEVHSLAPGQPGCAAWEEREPPSPGTQPQLRLLAQPEKSLRGGRCSYLLSCTICRSILSLVRCAESLFSALVLPGKIFPFCCPRPEL